MLNVRRKYAGRVCEYNGGFQEIRWDLVGCNLSCHFCWSPASRPLESGDPIQKITSKDLASVTIGNLQNRSRSFIRFTGGEPTLQWPDLVKSLIFISQEIPKQLSRPPILFQTNGIEIGAGRVDLDMLKYDPDQQFLFELSLKGTNKNEFSILTNKHEDLYEYQLEGYRRLSHFSDSMPNICIIAVLGVYHSSINQPSKYAFVEPSTGNLLFDDVNKWAPGFSTIWNTARFKWVEKLRMSPMGVWKNLLKRCGPEGKAILRNFPNGISTNTKRLFLDKPQSHEYARQIVTRRFW
jgi:uncharacterized Fe-S cluster-containing radical SAM superfamily protein